MPTLLARGLSGTEPLTNLCVPKEVYAWRIIHFSNLHKGTAWASSGLPEMKFDQVFLLLNIQNKRRVRGGMRSKERFPALANVASVVSVRCHPSCSEDKPGASDAHMAVD